MRRKPGPGVGAGDREGDGSWLSAGEGARRTDPGEEQGGFSQGRKPVREQRPGGEGAGRLGKSRGREGE